jgi:hypothetical protein
MKVNFLIIKLMVKENKFGLMDVFMKVNIKIIRNLDKEKKF